LPPPSPPFPYTTLFRSENDYIKPQVSEHAKCQTEIAGGRFEDLLARSKLTCSDCVSNYLYSWSYLDGAAEDLRVQFSEDSDRFRVYSDSILCPGALR